jgi:hypothetical protein
MVTIRSSIQRPDCCETLRLIRRNAHQKARRLCLFCAPKVDRWAKRMVNFRYNKTRHLPIVSRVAQRDRIKANSTRLSILTLLAVALTAWPEPVTAQSVGCSTTTFCGGWLAVCRRTGGQADVCQQRHEACLTSGCFFFNRPGPRCKDNPGDLALTTACFRRAR